ncbi:MAG: hypothetical protein MJ071_01040 [Oscillospiraceae bacterium]|nr:hypothetical protein [Oscillospiraceae bacterium]
MNKQKHYQVTADALEFDPEIVRQLTRETKKEFYGEEPDKHRKLLRTMRKVWQNDLTIRQRDFLFLYYKEHMNIQKIADTYQINVSTVCRTMQRGRNRMRKILQYFI